MCVGRFVCPHCITMGWRRLVPYEVYPLAIFSGAIVLLASYRCYKLASSSEVMLTKKCKEKFQWSDEDSARGASQSGEDRATHSVADAKIIKDNSQ